MSSSAEKNSIKKRDKKIILATLLAVALFLTPFLAKTIADKYAISKIDKALETLKGDCYAIYDSASYDLWARSLNMKKISVICLEEEAARFDSVNISDINSEFLNNLPMQMLVTFDDAVINADAKIFGRWGEIASKIGLTAVHHRGRLYYSLSENKDVFSFAVNAENLGVAAGEINIENPEPFGNDPIKTIKRLFDTPGAVVDITLKDTGFVNVALERYAVTIGKDSSIKALERALQGIENRIRNKSKSDPIVAKKLEEIYKFLQNPAEINIKTAKEDALSIKGIYKSLDYTGWKGFANSVENFKPEITAK